MPLVDNILRRAMAGSEVAVVAFLGVWLTLGAMLDDVEALWRPRNTISCPMRRWLSVWLVIGGVMLWPASVASQGIAFQPVSYQFFTDAGAVCNACKLYAFEAGTTTPLDVYSDEALTTPTAQPLVLSASGRASFYLAADSYKFRLDTSADAVIWTQDNVTAAAPYNVASFTGKVQYQAPTTLTVSGAAVTVTRNVHALDTSGGAANLDTITATNVSTGFVLTVYGADPGANPVTLRDGTGNMDLAGGNFTLSNANLWMQLIYQGTTWYELARSNAGAGVENTALCAGRITLTSGTPITAADVKTATTVYFTPYQGNVCALYDGSSAWTPVAFAEASLALGSDTANVNYDLFAYNNGGTFTLEQRAWSTDTARAIALTLQDGVYVLTGVPTRRYLGTYRTTSAAGETEDSAAKRYVWNYYHRVPRDLRVVETTNTWTYTTATYRQANAATANQLDLVVGLAESELSVDVQAMVENSAAAVDVFVAIGEDSTTTPVSNQLILAGETQVADQRIAVSAYLRKWPAIGRHYYVWLEKSEATGTSTWLGDNADSASYQSGIVGTLR